LVFQPLGGRCDQGGAGAEIKDLLAQPGSARQRIPGLHMGAMLLSDDFDDPLPEDYLGGKL
jgi:hypothetical protein